MKKIGKGMDKVKKTGKEKAKEMKVIRKKKRMEERKKEKKE